MAHTDRSEECYLHVSVCSPCGPDIRGGIAYALPVMSLYSSESRARVQLLATRIRDISQVLENLGPESRLPL